jgi:hypothetical protein
VYWACYHLDVRYAYLSDQALVLARFDRFGTGEHLHIECGGCADHASNTAWADTSLRGSKP